MSPALRVAGCDTLMLDMDGTLLDLAYDNFMWLRYIPAVYARERGLDPAAAEAELRAQYRGFEGRLDWYCLDQWSARLNLDIMALHRAHRSRIGWLPGAREFLQALRRPRRLLLVTNSHPDTLRLKCEVTGLAAYFDRVYTSHEFGHAKEDTAFWDALARLESFDPARTVVVDDNEAVLDSAGRWGLEHRVAITRPDTTRPRRQARRHAAVEGVGELMVAASGRE